MPKTRTQSTARKKKPPFPDPNAIEPGAAGDDEGNGEADRLPTDTAPGAPEAGRGIPFGQPDEHQGHLPFEEAPIDETLPVETPAELPAGRIAAIPLAPLPAEGYLPQHVDCQLRTRGQRERLKRILIGLDQTGARLANGQRVANYADVIRWLLDNVQMGREE